MLQADQTKIVAHLLDADFQVIGHWYFDALLDDVKIIQPDTVQLTFGTTGEIKVSKELVKKRYLTCFQIGHRPIRADIRPHNHFREVAFSGLRIGGSGDCPALVNFPYGFQSQLVRFRCFADGESGRSNDGCASKVHLLSAFAKTDIFPPYENTIPYCAIWMRGKSVNPFHFLRKHFA